MSPISLYFLGVGEKPGFHVITREFETLFYKTLFMFQVVNDQ